MRLGELFAVSWTAVTGRRIIVDVAPGHLLRLAGAALVVVGLLCVVWMVVDPTALTTVGGMAPGTLFGIVLAGLIGNVGLHLATRRHRVIVDRDKGTVEDIRHVAAYPRKATHRLAAFDRVVVGGRDDADAAAPTSVVVSLRSASHTIVVATIPASRSQLAHDLAAALASASGLRLERTNEVAAQG